MAEVGRPTVMTPETIQKLEDGFLKGLSDRESSLYAGIVPQTLYNYCKDNPEFLERKEELKENVKMRAKLNIQEAIDAKDKQLSQWYLERRDADFKPKQEQENKGQITVEIIRFEDPAPAQVHTPPVPDSIPQGS